MNITSILWELKSERTRIDQAIAAITSINSTNHRSSRHALSTSSPKRRGRMSVAARRRLSLLLKQRWAQGKMKPRAAEGKPTKTANAARHMSAAARNKIAAAQRARWAAWRKRKKAA